MAFAREYGLPVAIKANVGGGRGLKVARRSEELKTRLTPRSVSTPWLSAAASAFAQRFLDQPRHAEVQVPAEANGKAVVGTPECSLRRRNQLLVESAHAAFLTLDRRSLIHKSSKAICREADYDGARKVELLADKHRTISSLRWRLRLQVEQPRHVVNFRRQSGP